MEFSALLAALDRWLFNVLRGIAIFCFTLLIVLLTGNVFVRFVPVMSFHWFDEVVEWAFAWMIFMGAAALWMRNDHFKVEWITPRLKGKRAGHLFKMAVELMSLFFLTIFFYQSLQLTIQARDWTPVFHVTRRVMYLSMPLAGCIMVIYSIRNVIREFSALLATCRHSSPASPNSG